MPLIETLGLRDVDLTAEAQKMVAEGKAPSLQIAYQIIRVSRIIKRSQWDNLVTAERRLCLYFRPSRTARNRIVTNELLEVTCHVPAKQDYLAYRAIARVEKLLYNQEVNNRIYEFEGQLGELPTMTGFVCVGARFSFYAVK